MNITTKNAATVYASTTNTMAASAADRMRAAGINVIPCVDGITLQQVQAAYDDAMLNKTLLPKVMFFAAKKLLGTKKTNKMEAALFRNKRGF